MDYLSLIGFGTMVAAIISLSLWIMDKFYKPVKKQGLGWFSSWTAFFRNATNNESRHQVEELIKEGEQVRAALLEYAANYGNKDKYTRIFDTGLYPSEAKAYCHQIERLCVDLYKANNQFITAMDAVYQQYGGKNIDEKKNILSSLGKEIEVLYTPVAFEVATQKNVTQKVNVEEEHKPSDVKSPQDLRDGYLYKCTSNNEQFTKAHGDKWRTKEEIKSVIRQAFANSIDLEFGVNLFVRSIMKDPV